MYVQGEYLYLISSVYSFFSAQGYDTKRYVYVCMAVFICVTPPDITKNDTDLKFSTHTPIDLI